MPIGAFPFSIEMTESVEYDAAGGVGPVLGQVVFAKQYTGPQLVATATVQMLATGRTAYLAQERVVGTLDGADGSFVLQHGAAGGEDFEARQWAFVVAGSGTGALETLRGEGHVEHGLLTLDYVLGA